MFLSIHMLLLVKLQLIVRFSSLLEIILLTNHTTWHMSPLEIDCSFFVDENKALVKGEHAVESNHVVIITHDPESCTL